MAEGEVGLRATLKDRAQTAKGLRDVEQGVDRVGRSADTAGRRARTGARGFDAMRRSGKLAASAIKVGFGVALAAGYGVVRLLKSSFDEAREAQKVGAITRATIKSMGAAAAVSARHVDKLSTRLSLMAGIDDEIIQGGANVLLRFSQIRNEMGKGNQIYDRATTAATDMAAALAGGSGGEINVAAAAKVVGKALADPEKGMTALKKAQIVLTQSQQDSIKSMVDQGDTLGAQKVLLGAIEDRYKGTAAAQATWGDKAKVLFANIEERLGTALLPLLDDVERWFVRKGGPALDHYVGVFEDKGVPALKHFMDQARPLANKVLPSVATGLGDVRDVLSVAAPYAADLVGAFKNMPSWARKAIVGGALAGFVGSKTGVTSAVKSLIGGKSSGGILGAISKAKPLPVYVVNSGIDIPGGGKGGPGAPIVTSSSATANERGLAARANATTRLLIPQVVAAAAATLGLEWFNNHVTPDATQPAIAPGSGGTGAVPGGLDDAFPDDNVVNSSIEKLKSAFSGLFGTDGTVRRDSAATKASLSQLLLTPAGLAPKYASSTEQLLLQPIDKANTHALVYQGTLDLLGRPITTHISADTSQASTAVSRLAGQIQSALSQFFSFGSVDTTPTAPTPTTPPKHPRTSVPGAPTTNSLSDFHHDPVPRLQPPEIRNVIELDGRVVFDSVLNRARRAEADL